MLRRMGPLQDMLEMIPGMREQLKNDADEAELARVEAIVLSMPQERRSPIVIDGKRRLRSRKGSGTTVEQVNQLLEALEADGEDDEADGAGRCRPSRPSRRPRRLCPPDGRVA